MFAFVTYNFSLMHVGVCVDAWCGREFMWCCVVVVCSFGCNLLSICYCSFRCLCGVVCVCACVGCEWCCYGFGTARIVMFVWC